MNLYLIRRSNDDFVKDAFSFAVVAAETRKAARLIHPTEGVTWCQTKWMRKGRDYGFDIWTDPKHVRAKLIGVALAGTAAGTICTAFS